MKQDYQQDNGRILDKHSPKVINGSMANKMMEEYLSGIKPHVDNL